MDSKKSPKNTGFIRIARDQSFFVKKFRRLLQSFRTGAIIKKKYFIVSKHTLKCDFENQKIGEVFLSRKNTGKNARSLWYAIRIECGI